MQRVEGQAVYNRFSFKAAIELAAPPTWAAAIMSVLVGGVAAIALTPLVSVTYDLRTLLVWTLMLVTAVLMQAAVNTLNDYQDFKAGTDTAETVFDTQDASIVYNRINPKAALRFFIVLMMMAGVAGLAVVWMSGWQLLLVGFIAADIVILYSVGPRPISYLPLGEVISGLVMGGAITASTFFAITRSFTVFILPVTVVPIITIALIMLTNNTCDIERDIKAGRRTLPALLGRAASMQLARILCWGTLAFMVIWTLLFNIVTWRSIIVLASSGVFAVLLYLLLRRRIARAANGPYSLRYRKTMMQNAVGFCYVTNIIWAVMLLVGWVLGEVLNVF